MLGSQVNFEKLLRHSSFLNRSVSRFKFYIVTIDCHPYFSFLGLIFFVFSVDLYIFINDIKVFKDKHCAFYDLIITFID
jgi:hypothetical protein